MSQTLPPFRARLAVCVPTYNRESYLGTLLDAFLDQGDDTLQVVVSDNASTDGTQDLVERYSAQDRRVRYTRSPENLGPDRNYLRAVEASDADYCWLFGSDDVPAPGAVATMLDALREGSPDILLVDRLWCDLHMRPLRRDHLFRPPRPSLFDTADSAALVRYLNRAISLMALFSYLSAIVVRRDVWNAADPADDFIGSAYVHSARLLSAVARGCTVAYLPQALVLCRGDNDFFRQAGEYDRCRLDLHGYRRLIDTYLTDVSFAGPARGIMRREYGLARLLLVVASATPEQQSDLRSYLSYYEYDALRRLAVAAASSDGLHQALARIAPPARRAWWWYHRHADPSGDRRP